MRHRCFHRLPTGELIERRGVIASSLALGALIAGATAGSSVAAGAIGSHAAGEAADKQTAAANYAADVQAKSAAEALAFQKQQAAQDLANAQAASRGNYDQWAARQGRLSTLGQMVGMKPFQIPAYVPIQSVPQATPSGPNTPTAPTGYRNPHITNMGALVRNVNA